MAMDGVVQKKGAPRGPPKLALRLLAVSVAVLRIRRQGDQAAVNREGLQLNVEPDSLFMREGGADFGPALTRLAVDPLGILSVAQRLLLPSNELAAQPWQTYRKYSFIFVRLSRNIAMMRHRDFAGDIQAKPKATFAAGDELIVRSALQRLEYLTQQRLFDPGSMVVNRKSHLCR